MERNRNGTRNTFSRNVQTRYISKLFHFKNVSSSSAKKCPKIGIGTPGFSDITPKQRYLEIGILVSARNRAFSTFRENSPDFLKWKTVFQMAIEKTDIGIRFTIPFTKKGILNSTETAVAELVF